METPWALTWDALALGKWYDQYPWAIDGLIYLVLFVGIAKVTLGRRYQGRGGAAIAAGAGTALAVAASAFAFRAGFTLAQLGPVAWIVLLFLLGFMLFDLARSTGLPVLPAAAASTLVMVGVAAGFGTALDDWLIASGLLPFISVLAIGAVAVLVWSIVSTASRLLPRTREMASEQPSPLSQQPQGADNVRSETDAVLQVEASLLDLIKQMIAVVRQEGIGPASGRLLLEICRRHQHRLNQ